MTIFRQYLMSVICVSLLCAVIPIFVGDGGKRILRLICSIVLTVSVVGPILRIDPEPFMETTISDEEAQEISHRGKQLASEAVAAIIKEETEAYILDKARLLGLRLQAEVYLESEELPVPAGVTLYGVATRDQKAQLEEVLSGELGIPKEAQQWISG